ncbi:glycogenin glucosyltransferase, partial [Coemansia sp. RSA 1933]
ADQGLLNEHFSDWATDMPYRRLPFLYNSTANVYYSYEPALQRFGHEVRVVHFIGVSKPWDWERSPGGQLLSDPSFPERWRQLVNLWWYIHDEHVSGWRYWKGPFSKQVAFGKGYHDISKSVASEPNETHPEDSGKSSDKPDEEDRPKDLDSYRKEVPDWDKDWSWAANRVHPLDYAYLTTHTEMHSQQPDERREHPADADHHHHDHRHLGVESTDSRNHEQVHQHRLHLDECTPSYPLNNDAGYDGDSSGSDSDCDIPPVDSGPSGCDQPYREQAQPKVPEWMDSQRPWEDVAREGWMHDSRDYQPHQYDRAYVERHVAQTRPVNTHVQPHDGRPASQLLYSPVPLPENQSIYEATQVVLQPRDMNYRSERSHLEHMHDHEHGSDQQHHDNGGYHSEKAIRGSEPIGYYHHEDSGHMADRKYSQLQSQPQRPEHRESATAPATPSPLYFPQPRSPVTVNPVALWESNEEQFRRRAWAEQFRAAVPNKSAPDLGQFTPTQQTPYDAPDPTSVSGLDNRFPVSAMDHVDSRQLPKETPWKIGHVRQRKAEDNTQQNSIPGGIQFKEGVANDGNAREAAGQILRRWSESVVARNLKPRFGGITSDDITHSKVERGTDAIRLETTVSCEAENSNGERTVYRFTLSSTLDVGGIQTLAQASEPVGRPQFQTGTSSQSVADGMEDNGTGVAIDEAADRGRYIVTDLHQPDNYQEPAMSRRSSFVQLPLNSTRAPHLALQPRLDTDDQFAEADARYWRLQRQLIDLEMSQQRLDNESQRKAVNGSSDPAVGFSGGWAKQMSSDFDDLASPPTPTRKQVSSGFTVPERKFVRRSSAFSIADPAALAENSSVALAPVVPHVQATPDEQQHAAFNDNVTPAIYFQPPVNDPPKPDYPRNGRSHSDLRRIAAENSAQAVVSIGGDSSDNGYDKYDDDSDEQQAVTFAIDPDEQPAYATSLRNEQELDSDAERISLDDSDDERRYNSAIGRHPTPFPRRLRAGPESNESAPASHIERAPLHDDQVLLDLAAADFDTPSEPTSTPSTPGKQKIRPKIVWDDDDDSYIPPVSDKSLDAQWLRIIRGAPPPRAKLLPTKALEDNAIEQGNCSDTSAKSGQQAPTTDSEISGKDIPTDQLVDTSAKEPAVASDRLLSNTQVQDANSGFPKERKDRGSEEDSDGSSKKRNQTGVFNPSSGGGTFDPLSDSEADPTEDKLQERFWARAMKPSKSGSSTPYSPRRSKSVVEVSSDISPQDLAEWMRWQGDNSALNLEGFNDTSNDPSASEEPNQNQLLTPPSSKDANSGLQTVDSRLVDTQPPFEHSVGPDKDDSACDGASEDDYDDDVDGGRLEIWHQEHYQQAESEISEPDDALETLGNLSGPDLAVSASAGQF